MHAQGKKPKKNSANARSQPRVRTQKAKGGVAIVGAGRLGTALGLALNGARYRIEVVTANHASRARKAASLIGSDIVSLSSAQLERPGSLQIERLVKADVILIATSDGAIDSVARQLAALFRARRKQKAQSSPIALHTSGALSSEILGPMREAGFAVGSLHPLVSISDPISGAGLFRDAFFCVEGDRAAVRVAREMVRGLGGQSFSLEPGSKALYHAAAVTASGHVVALLDIAIEMLGRCGLSARRAQQVLLPLVRSTVTNLSTKDPAHALTGTLARADVSTVRRHLAAIESERVADALTAYLLLGERSIQLARGLGMNEVELTEIENLMDETARAIASAS